MRKPYSAALPAFFSVVSLVYGLASGCGGDVEETPAGPASSGAGGAGAGGGGAGGSAGDCSTVKCGEPGHVCVAGECVADCRKPGSVPCAAGTVCDVSDAGPGQCVAPGSPCLTTSEPEVCGDKVCGPGSACDGAGKCYPRVPCGTVICDESSCYGAACACSRAALCEPAPIGSVDGAGNGEPGTLHDDSFRSGIVDLEFDPACGAWAVTLISGPDYLRSIGPDGKVTSYTGVTNLNMGEVAVLQQIITPRSGPTIDWQDGPALDVSLSYICCETCGCVINASQPQGVARLEPMTGTLPIVIPSETYTKGIGPYGAGVTDTGPAGVTYGLDQVLYVGNVQVNGDYYRLDLKTQAQTLVATLPARVYASTPFDAVTMLVAVEGGDLYLVRPGTGETIKWAASDQPVTGMIRDFFDGSVYIARFDGSILKYDEKGMSTAFQTSKYPARLSIAPNGWLYALASPPPYYDHKPIVERWELPKTR